MILIFKPLSHEKKLLLPLLLLAINVTAFTQVTRLSNNTSYEWGFALTNTKIILRSAISNTLWVYDIPGNGFIQLSSAAIVEADYDYGIMNGKLYFAGRTVAEGIELWVSDGTPGGTSLLKDINTGAADSGPKNGFTVYNNELYFTANDGTTGRELWKTNGTGAGTVRVKDINVGAADAFTNSFFPDFKIINNVLVFTAATAADGDEPWKTDGLDLGTIELKDINSLFPGFGSGISGFTEYGSVLIFRASDFFNDAIWKTDGTPGGTVLVKDIDPNDNPISIFPPFFNFQNELYFAGDDGTNGFELWKTNGTDAGTVLVKDIDPGDDGMGTPNSSFPQLALTVKNSSKFFFAATTATEGTELWESDGTGTGTVLLKDIVTGPSGSDPFILPNFSGSGLFQGNKFFFTANTPGVEGNEFYVSDGTPGGTFLLNDINPGPANGFDGINLSWFYAPNKFYFLADDGITGSELWQSDGTAGAGTSQVDNVNLTLGEGSDINFCGVASNTLFFFGTDGDDPVNTDFFKLDASVSLPLLWISFEARPSGNDVLLIWETAAEEQTDHFVVQRSNDGINYHDIGQLTANGTGSNNYRFTDADAMKLTGIKKLYYRVKYIDKDGKSALSRIATIALNKLIASILILPNPVVNELKLVIEATAKEQAMISVIDFAGKTVLQRSVTINRGKNTVVTDASGIPNGIYLLKISTGESVSVERFVIQH